MGEVERVRRRLFRTTILGLSLSEERLIAGHAMAVRRRMAGYSIPEIELLLLRLTFDGNELPATDAGLDLVDGVMARVKGYIERG
jgi:hypothetical protein